MKMNLKILVSRDNKWQHQAVQAVSPLVDRTVATTVLFYALGPLCCGVKCMQLFRQKGSDTIVVLQSALRAGCCRNHAADFVGLDVCFSMQHSTHGPMFDALKGC